MSGSNSRSLGISIKELSQEKKSYEKEKFRKLWRSMYIETSECGLWWLTVGKKMVENKMTSSFQKHCSCCE